jgi:hypothetical protein
MAGHFVLWKIQQGIINTYIALAGVNWTPLAHAAGTANGAGGVFPGWTPASRDDLNRVRSATGVPNRNNIPPHRYLTFPPGVPGAGLAAQLLNDKYGWITNLERPASPGFGMVALAPLASSEWNAGQKRDALVAQVTHGATSIEVYYLGSKEMS